MRSPFHSWVLGGVLGCVYINCVLMTIMAQIDNILCTTNGRQYIVEDTKRYVTNVDCSIYNWITTRINRITGDKVTETRWPGLILYVSRSTKFNLIFTFLSLDRLRCASQSPVSPRIHMYWHERYTRCTTCIIYRENTKNTFWPWPYPIRDVYSVYLFILFI